LIALAQDCHRPNLSIKTCAMRWRRFRCSARVASSARRHFDFRPVAPIDQKKRAGLIIAEFIDGKGR
jgi:hypothetical protein